MFTRRNINLGLLASAGLVATLGSAAAAAEVKTIALPPPWKDGGKPLAQALWLRRSTREFADRPLPIEVISNLLWSACGINRPATADRTVPSWRYALESEVFVAAADGAWRYDGKAHRLLLVTPEDIRGQTGVQDFVTTAALDLIYVADGNRLQGVAAEEKRVDIRRLAILCIRSFAATSAGGEEIFCVEEPRRVG
jgi:hypothetical protein